MLHVVKVFAGARGRWLAVAASVAVASAMFYAQSTETRCCAAAPTVSQAARTSSVPAAARVGQPTEAELLAASGPVSAADFQLALPRGIAPEAGLQVHTIWVARAISVMFLEIKTIGGYRQDPLPWHPNGLAIDVMIPNYHSPEGIELGNQIAGFALANAERWGVLHVIWRQGFYPGIGAPSWTADYGNETANHFDHVHIATDGGGYPIGRETYFLGSMRSEAA
ncbi:glycoside hydrolase [Mycobacterium sp. CVI_P3]|uniref:Glycoside hydrolase n=2 Tax=Mycobacterium pinniadriaticum TaxID=2994102 RepID=A0ABT3SHB9_9MYCO|nr:glycoside hydrolase [Mycobacterium pinniadriaticum]MCX2938901.1 glycoside hydrolase [Mycobacterium pinniadriaticum]